MGKLTNKARSELIYDVVNGVDDSTLAERYGVTERQIRYYRHNYRELINKLKTENNNDSQIQEDNKPDDLEDEPENEGIQYFECAECGQAIAEGTPFCSGCGEKLDWRSV